MNVELLDATNEEDVRLYEEGFYRAFIGYSNPGVRALWCWDDERRRLRTKVPYEDQWIFFSRDAEGKVSASLGVNFKIRVFQSAEYGFTRPGDEPRWVETISNFNRNKFDLLRIYEQARIHSIERGYETSFATCVQSLLDLYRKVGWQPVERRIRNGQERFLIRLDLKQAIGTS